MLDEQRRWCLARVLDGLRFPAEKWQIVTYAELYGADAGTCALLREIPLRQYWNLGEIVTATDGTPSTQT